MRVSVENVKEREREAFTKGSSMSKGMKSALQIKLFKFVPCKHLLSLPFSLPLPTLLCTLHIVHFLQGILSQIFSLQGS